jgi:hypothetical protein
MSRTDRRPYLEKLARRGPLSIWLVDGAYLRTHVDIEFDNYGQHSDFKFIPRNELWLDRETRPDEQRFFIERMLVERRLLRRGTSPERANEKAMQAEKALRRKAGDLKRMQRGRKSPNPRRVHERLWKRLKPGLQVWVVNSRLVRSAFDLDFVAGGHDLVYDYVPAKEVWIDNDTTEAERPFILLHELHERRRMAKGWTYERAHASANRIELRCRRRPATLKRALAREGWSRA